MANTILLYGRRSYNALKTPIEYVPEENEMKLEPMVSHVAPETDYSFMRERESSEDEGDTTMEEEGEASIDSMDMERQERGLYPELFGRSMSNPMGRASTYQYGVEALHTPLNPTVSRFSREPTLHNITTSP